MHSLRSWQLRELTLTLVLTTHHLFVFFYCFLPRLIAAQALRRIKNATIIAGMLCFMLLLIIFHESTCFPIGSSCSLPLGASVLYLVSRITAWKFQDYSQTPLCFKKMKRGKIVSLQFNSCEIIQASFPGRIIMSAKHKRKNTPSFDNIESGRQVDSIWTNCLSLAAPKVLLNEVHAGRDCFYLFIYLFYTWLLEQILSSVLRTQGRLSVKN